MAKQSGTAPLSGTLGNTTYAKTRNGYIAKEKTRLTKAMMDANPKFQALRDQGAEFERASKAAKLLRSTFNPIIQNMKDNRMSNRLTALMNKVVKLDLINPRGLRNVLDGELEIVKGFEFNVNGSIESTLRVQPTITLNRVTGEAKVVIDSFVPTIGLKCPQNSTHFKISMGAASINFETEDREAKFAEGAYQVVNKLPAALISLTVNLSPASTTPLFMVLRVEFAVEINGIMEPIESSSFTACTVVKVDTGV